MDETFLPPLFGLVLAGGRSIRMGQDKGSLCLGGETLRMRAARTLSAVCDQVFVSLRSDQAASLEPGLQPLCDDVSDQGPLAALAAAFAYQASVAWLTLPCDMPGVTAALLALLIQARRAMQPAVACRRPDGQGPEPLLAIWEPAMAPLIRHAMDDGLRSPRRVLQSVRCGLVTVPDPARLRNLNTPADWAAWGRASP